MFWAECIKDIETFPGLVAVIGNHINLNCNKMLIMEPVQYIFYFIIFFKIFVLLKILLGKNDKKMKKCKGIFIQVSLEFLVYYYLSILDNIRLSSFQDTMSTFYNWILVDNKIIGEILPYGLLILWLKKRVIFDSRKMKLKMTIFMACFYLNYILMGIFILFRWLEFGGDYFSVRFPWLNLILTIAKILLFFIEKSDLTKKERIQVFTLSILPLLLVFGRDNAQGVTLGIAIFLEVFRLPGNKASLSLNIYSLVTFNFFVFHCSGNHSEIDWVCFDCAAVLFDSFHAFSPVIMLIKIMYPTLLFVLFYMILKLGDTS